MFIYIISTQSVMALFMFNINIPQISILFVYLKTYFYAVWEVIEGIGKFQRWTGK